MALSLPLVARISIMRYNSHTMQYAQKAVIFLLALVILGSSFLTAAVPMVSANACTSISSVTGLNNTVLPPYDAQNSNVHNVTISGSALDPSSTYAFQFISEGRIVVVTTPLSIDAVGSTGTTSGVQWAVGNNREIALRITNPDLLMRSNPTADPIIGVWIAETNSAGLSLSPCTLGNYSANTQATTQGISCGWEPHNSGSKVKFCMRGFQTEAQILSHHFEASCTKNCSSTWGGSFWNLFKSGQKIYPVDLGVAEDQDGWYTCFSPGGFDQSVIDTYNACINPGIVEKLSGVAGCTGAIGLGALGITATGGIGTGAIGITVGATCGQALATLGGDGERLRSEIRQLAGSCLPEFEIVVEPSNVCQSATFKFEPNLDFASTVPIGNNLSDDVFSLCNQIPEGQRDSTGRSMRQQCIDCAGGKGGTAGVWTAVGCIKREPERIISSIVKIGLGAAGGFTLLTFLAAGFILSTSQGEAKQYEKAKEMLGSAVIGLLFIIFSVTILEFIGVSILRIPGFGGG